MEVKDLTKEQRWTISDNLKNSRLPQINKKCRKVRPRKNLYSMFGKRFLDVIISGLALLITLPVNGIILVVTFFDVGIPVFFRQKRAGKNGEIFEIVKFRNMRNTTDERGELLPPDQRVTKFGKFVRKTSLDELLNFWSIFKGDMSLIGPRPLVPEYANRFSDRHKMRMAVKPGLECPPRRIPDHAVTWHEQFENDIWYVEHISFLTDCFMCIQLVKLTFDKKSTAVRSTGTRGSFAGYDLNGKAITYNELSSSELEEFLQG